MITRDTLPGKETSPFLAFLHPNLYNDQKLNIFDIVTIGIYFFRPHPDALGRFRLSDFGRMILQMRTP